jgi:hypothetical protein
MSAIQQQKVGAKMGGLASPVVVSQTVWIQHASHTPVLFLPLQRGTGPMVLMLWLDWVT